MLLNLCGDFGRRGIGLAGLLVLLGVDLSCPGAGDAPASTASAPIAATQAAEQRIFVAAFTNETGQDQYDPAAAGMGDVVAIMLAQQPKIRIVERQQLLSIAAEQTLSLKGLTGDKYSLAAGKILQAQRVLTGRVYLADNKLIIGVQIIDLATQRVLAAEQEACRPADLNEAALQLARRLGGDLELPLKPLDTKNIDASPLAALHFGKALSHYYAGDMDAAIMQFMRTTDLDPDLVDAHNFCGLAYAKLNQPRDAVVELKVLLRRSPESPYAPQAKKLLDEAEAAAHDEHPIPRPGADATDQAKPADKPAAGGKP